MPTTRSDNRTGSLNLENTVDQLLRLAYRFFRVTVDVEL